MKCFMKRAAPFAVLVLLTVCCSSHASAASEDTAMVIDMTDVATGAGVEHDCNDYLVTEHDDSSHWKRCTVCDQIYSKEYHKLSDGYWTMGNSCSPSNVYKRTCSCGYSTTSPNTRAHTPIQGANYVYHVQLCSSCGAELCTHEYHKDAYGNRLTCTNKGRCVVCGITTGVHNCGLVVHESTGTCSESACAICGRKSVEPIQASYTHSGTSDVEVLLTVTLNRDVTDFYYNGGVNFVDSKAGSVLSKDSSFDGHRKFTIRTKVHCNNSGIHHVGLGIVSWTTVDGQSWTGYCYADVKAEAKAPVVSKISQTALSTNNDWTTKMQFTVSGIENFDKSVKLTVKDSFGNVYVDNASVSVSGTKWSYSFVPDIEAPVSGKDFIITVSDNSDNVATKTFTAYKIDGVLPVCTTKESTDTNWSRTKNWTATATDGGSGCIQVSVIDQSDYLSSAQDGNQYTKKYTFIGDLYESKEIPVYYKDGAGNISVEYLTVSYLDNTAPTIKDTAVSVGYGQSSVTVTANDINTKLGKSGSGIAGYGFSRSVNKKPSAWQKSNKFWFSSEGEYYIWCRDNVGNISYRKVFVPIKSRVLFDAASGQCNISSAAYLYGCKYQSLPIPTKTGYTFEGWFTEDGTQIKDDSDVIRVAELSVSAHWSPNHYMIVFDANTDISVGVASGSTAPVTATYDESLLLPRNGYTRVTASNIERRDGDVVSKQSVFLGWSTNPDDETPMYTDGQSVLNLTTVPNDTITLYAIWDDCPKFTFVEFPDRYFTLADAQSGVITEENLLSTVSACDRETIPLDKKTAAQVAATGSDEGIILYNYQASEFTSLTDPANIGITYRVTDEIGNTAYLNVTVYVTSNDSAEQVSVDYIRNISDKYYVKTVTDGGLNPDSQWVTNDAYADMLQDALSSDDSIYTYMFSDADIKAIRKYIVSNGFGNAEDENALQELFDRY